MVILSPHCKKVSDLKPAVTSLCGVCMYFLCGGCHTVQRLTQWVNWWF